ncbi:MAG: hypothetical protein SGBAC_011348 [Bacillariaceae sp.]
MSSFEEDVESAIPGMFYMFAGTDDSETAADIPNIDTFDLPDPAGKSGGACTSALLQALYRDEGEEDVTYTWLQTLEIMRDKIGDMGLTQVPKLSSSKPIDVNEELFIVPPECEGTKRALLVGINYVDEESRLSGCHNDVRNMKYYLMDYLGFERQNMLILEDDDLHHFPTKQLILDGLRTLAQVSQPGDVIFIHFSGHGSQVVDRDSNEGDGFDEVLIPGDYKDSGPIFDDEIYHLFVTQVQAGVNVVAVIDCCHAGTAMDLPYVCQAGDEEIHVDDTFRMPVDGSGGIKERSMKTSGKKKKKKKKDNGEEAPKKKKKKKKKPLEGEEDDEDAEEEREPESDKKKKKKGFFGFGKKKK